MKGILLVLKSLHPCPTETRDACTPICLLQYLCELTYWFCSIDIQGLLALLKALLKTTVSGKGTSEGQVQPGDQ